MMKIYFVGFFLFLLSSRLEAQQSCLYYAYSTSYVFPNVLQANISEREALANGWRDWYVRINDTTFENFYRPYLKIYAENRKWLLNPTRNMQPISCETFKDYIIYDGELSFSQIKTDSFACGETFDVIIANDFIYYVNSDKKKQLRYSLKGDTIQCRKGKPEFDGYRDPYKSFLLRKEMGAFFGQPVAILVFKEVYYNREEVLWYSGFNMILLKRKVIYPNGSYDLTVLNGVFQF